MELNKRITFFRNQKGITVNKLANLAGISQSYLRDIELGNKKPTVEVLEFICDALGITLKEFFDDDTMNNLQSNDLLQQIYRLTPKQRQLLTNFLKSLEE